MNDADLATRLQHTNCFAKEIQRVINMKDVEEHGIADRSIGEAGSLADKIAAESNDIVQPGIHGFPLSAGAHLRFDINGGNRTRDTLGSGNGEGPIAATEFDHIAARTRAVEFGDDSTGVEEAVPLLFHGHAAFSAFHAISLIRE
jgi:hypothetical protein